MHLFYTPDIALSHELPADEAAHALRVLRLQPGDEVVLTDGQGCFYRARISECNRKRCLVEVESKEVQAPLWEGRIHLALAPTKNMDRMEWLAEKATEIGFDELTFLNCQWSERRIVKGERIEKILVSAMKQSLKARLPKLNAMTDFTSFVKQPFSGQKFIAHCHDGEKQPLRQVLHPDEDALVLIGPEGDFSPDEVAEAIRQGFTPVTLGNTRLRTETAALVAVHLMNLAHTNPTEV
ncbi:MAG: 16S rRNA (uracil(1498)-N(3))-methyltransferase [Bacteroides sp.]